MAEIRVEALQSISDIYWCDRHRAVSGYQGSIPSVEHYQCILENLKADAEKRVKERSMRNTMSVDMTVDISMSNNELEDLLKAERKKVWELANKITSPVSEGGYTGKEVVEIFDCSNPFHNTSAEEALKKVEAYENRIKIGDEVEVELNGVAKTAYVIKVSQLSNPDVVVISVPNGNPFWVKRNEVKKTGSHSDTLEKCIKEVVYGEKDK